MLNFDEKYNITIRHDTSTLVGFDVISVYFAFKWSCGREHVTSIDLMWHHYQSTGEMSYFNIHEAFVDGCIYFVRHLRNRLFFPFVVCISVCTQHIATHMRTVFPLCMTLFYISLIKWICISNYSWVESYGWIRALCMHITHSKLYCKDVDITCNDNKNLKSCISQHIFTSEQL